MGTSKSNRSASLLWPALIVLTGAWAVVPSLTPPIVMVLIALSLFAIIKLHTFIEFRRRRNCGATEIAAWFLLWPGLNANAFFVQQTTTRPAFRDVGFAFAKIVVGMACLWTAVRLTSVPSLASGWLFLLGTVLVLHFGTFHLAALTWQYQGRDVQPIMNWPVLATTVGDFWSHRWNLAFRDYAGRFIFRPLARRFGAVPGVLAGYLFSGLVHELAISVPANGGYGLPTLYFLIQGVAILAERKLEAHGWLLKGRLAGWAWTILVTAPAASILFHPPFVRRVVVPMIEGLRTWIQF